MLVAAEIVIHGSAAEVWAAITNIEGAATTIGGIESAEILTKPSTGIVGLKWRETRLLFGKPTAVDKWITEAIENECCRTRAEDGGFVYVTTRRITPHAEGVVLSEAHESLPQGLLAQLMSIPMRLFFRGAIRKYLLQDLHDIKVAVERTARH